MRKSSPTIETTVLRGDNAGWAANTGSEKKRRKQSFISPAHRIPAVAREIEKAVGRSAGHPQHGRRSPVFKTDRHPGKAHTRLGVRHLNAAHAGNAGIGGRNRGECGPSDKMPAWKQETGQEEERNRTRCHPPRMMGRDISRKSNRASTWSACASAPLWV